MTMVDQPAAALTREDASDVVAKAGAPPADIAIMVKATRFIEEVESAWRELEAEGIESPGQSYGFIRLWTEARRIPAADQLYVTIEQDGEPLALLPLCRTRRFGGTVYTWFAGKHVGCAAPLIDRRRFARLSSAERARMWRCLAETLTGADLVHLPAVPAEAGGIAAPFAELGRALPVETLYRAAFQSWEEANTTQRSKSRRKHDRQQGERLEALGEVSFEVVGNGPAAAPVLEVMFRQRARRFEIMGVADPFAPEDVNRFYRDLAEPDSGVELKLHVLRLDGEIVAVRYNIVAGDRLFCLISSMSDEERVQPGSPGKQCLLRVMQTVFDEGYRVFDMGAGFTDEKRHWCNERVGLSDHYLPLTLKGRAMAAGHALFQSLRARVKNDARLLKLVKDLRARLRGSENGISAN